MEMPQVARKPLRRVAGLHALWFSCFRSPREQNRRGTNWRDDRWGAEDFSEKTRFLSPVPPENKAESKGKPLFFAWFVRSRGGDTGKDYRILKEKTAIGKSEDSDIVISNDFVSRNHALLSYEDRKFILNDLQSTNHTYVNDKKISRRILKDDDLVRFGDALYEFKCL